MAEGGVNETLWSRAQRVTPGGVNSPVRAFRAVGGSPRFIARGAGATVWDEDGRAYLDLVSSWGALLHGHAHPKIVEAVTRAAQDGTSFGAPTRREVELAEVVTARVPGVEQIRFVNSGTEATMAALRLARAATGRTAVVKFAGGYHGASDGLLARAGSGVATLGLPDSAGVPESTTAQTIVLAYNDLAAVRDALRDHPVAAVIVEPIAGNMGCVPPLPGYLEGLRDACSDTGALLIFDEVMTGFRVGPAGASGRFGVRPDLWCFGKVIGGGLPVGAYGGPADLMRWIAPLGPVYQAGTLSGNPLAMAAGLASLELAHDACYGHLESLGVRLEAGLSRMLRTLGMVQRVGSMVSVFFRPEPVIDETAAKASDLARFGRIFHRCLEQGVYLPPSGLEAWFLNAAMSQSDMDRVIDAFGQAIARE